MVTEANKGRVNIREKQDTYDSSMEEGAEERLTDQLTDRLTSVSRPASNQSAGSEESRRGIADEYEPNRVFGFKAEDELLYKALVQESKKYPSLNQCLNALVRRALGLDLKQPLAEVKPSLSKAEYQELLEYIEDMEIPDAVKLIKRIGFKVRTIGKLNSGSKTEQLLKRHPISIKEERRELLKELGKGEVECKKCGEGLGEATGYFYTTSGKVPTFQCKRCGYRWSRSYRGYPVLVVTTDYKPPPSEDSQHL